MNKRIYILVEFTAIKFKKKAIQVVITISILIVFQPDGKNQFQTLLSNVLLLVEYFLPL